MKKRAVWRWLLLIPLTIVLGFAIVMAGFIMEGRQAAQTLAQNPDIHGHPSGYSAFLTTPLALILILIAAIVAIVKAVKGARFNRRLREAMQEDSRKEF